MTDLSEIPSADLRSELDRRAIQPFVDFAQAVRYNPSLLDRIHQGETWTDQDEITWNIVDMETSHIENLLGWLSRRMPQMKLHEEFRMTMAGMGSSMGEAAADCFESAHSQLLEESDEEWFSDLPLVRALREELASRL